MVREQREAAVSRKGAGPASKFPTMVYRCRNDRDRTMESVSEGCLLLTGYRPADLILNQTVAYGQLIHPEDWEALWSSMQAAIDQQRPFRHAYRLITLSGEEKWVWEQGRALTSTGGGLLAVEGSIADVAERLPAYQTLARRVEARTRELSTLLELSRNVTSTLELEPLLELILEQLRAVVEYTGATVFSLRGGEELTVLAYRGPAPLGDMLRLRFHLESAEVHREVVRGRKPCIIPDVRGDAPLARAFRESVGDWLETNLGYARSWMGVPLIARNRTMGMLSLYHERPDQYSPRHAQLALAFANQAVVALENARLYREERERRREAEQRRQVAEGLRDILNIINTNRPLSQILEHVVAQAARLLGTDMVILYQGLSRDGAVTVHGATGLPPLSIGAGELPVGPRIWSDVDIAKQPVAVSDVAFAFSESHSPLGPVSVAARLFRGLLVVPVVIEGEACGGLEFYYPLPRQFSQEEIRLAVALADQAALAIQNARLRVQAEQTAVEAERNRLARDLHDAVTQTLFSASLIAEVLPRLAERNPREVARRLEELRQLTRGALAEMRALLLELRPAALTEMGLGDLLRQLAEAITGRARLPVGLQVDGHRMLPPDVQVALYRIAQEALNNVAKHGRASHASMRLSYLLEGVELLIGDDGRGFDPGEISPQHLGLGIMRERAEAIGANLRIESEVGQGTCIVVSWASRQE